MHKPTIVWTNFCIELTNKVNDVIKKIFVVFHCFGALAFTKNIIFPTLFIVYSLP